MCVCHRQQLLVDKPETNNHRQTRSTVDEQSMGNMRLILAKPYHWVKRPNKKRITKEIWRYKRASKILHILSYPSMRTECGEIKMHLSAYGRNLNEADVIKENSKALLCTKFKRFVHLSPDFDGKHNTFIPNCDKSQLWVFSSSDCETRNSPWAWKLELGWKKIIARRPLYRNGRVISLDNKTVT